MSFMSKRTGRADRRAAKQRTFEHRAHRESGQMIVVDARGNGSLVTRLAHDDG
jgi:hypothetical protein